MAQAVSHGRGYPDLRRGYPDFLDAVTLTEVFPCFQLSYKTHARVNLAKTGHGPHSHRLLCSSVYCLFCVVLCTVCV